MKKYTMAEAALAELERRRADALAMGGAEKLEKRRVSGRLDARARLDLLFDANSFTEVGLYAFSGNDPQKTPAHLFTVRWAVG